MTGPRPVLLVALGGNALIRQGEAGTAAEQFANLAAPARQLARLSRRYRLLITHGNGPQVGNLLLQQEACAEVPKLPLELLVAMTQGQIGYMVESVLDAELQRQGTVGQKLVSLISYILVDPADPAFTAPTKPIGPAYPEAGAADLPWPTVATARGRRRVVASPEPVTVVEKGEILALLEADFIVICCGGGGIPVIREGRGFHGVDAVIDKDLASARLASEVGAQLLLIATDVPGVALDFGTSRQRWLRRLTMADAAAQLAAGQFPPGSMGPKIEAALRFLRDGGRRALVCAVDDLEAALAGRAGTEINRTGD
jgi:carbamate kinase